MVQVAKQEGEYLAKLLGEGKVHAERPLPANTKPFAYSHKGSLAYVGSDKAVMDTPQLGPLTGRTAGKNLNIKSRAVLDIEDSTIMSILR